MVNTLAVGVFDQDPAEGSMRPLKWIGYALLTIGLSLAVLSAFVPLPADSSSLAPADAFPASSGWRTVVAWHGDGSLQRCDRTESAASRS